MTWTLFFQIVIVVLVVNFILDIIIIIDMIIAWRREARASEPVEGKSEKLYTSD